MTPRRPAGTGFARALARASAHALVSCALALLVAGCGSNAVVQEAPRVPDARKEAVTKMMRGVERAAQASSLDEAIALFEQAVSEDPELWEARYNLGVLLAQRGDLAKARQQLEKAQELAPNAEDVVSALGEVLRRAEDPKAAVAILTAFVSGFPQASQARRVLVTVLRESGQLELALEQARELLKRESKDPSALAELALTHLELGQVEVAELLIREALEAPSRTAVVERAAGLIALRRGEDALAFAHFAKATELDPTDTAAALNTATVLLQAGVYERAEKYFRAVLAVEPDADAAKLGLSAALRGQGNRDNPGPYRAAEALLQEILQARPQHWAAAHNLAVLYSESMDRPAEATALYAEFLSLCPPEHPARGKAKKWVDEHNSATPEPSPRAAQ
jgi:tetratricopeptide (TPR) repeat protein